MIRPFTAKTGDAGIAIESCRHPPTQMTEDALQYAFAPDAMVAKMFSEMSWLLVGSVTIGGIAERCHRHGSHRKLVRKRLSKGRWVVSASAAVPTN